MGIKNSPGRCPKCGGTVYLDSDYNGFYEQCLQCGHMRDLGIVIEAKQTGHKTANKSKGGNIAS
jgi:hypothetical protein